MPMQESNNVDMSNLNSLLLFILKVIIVTISIYLMTLFMTPSIPKIPDNERNRLLLISFIQNPHVLYRLSVLKEESGDVEASILLVESAIGLLEMNGANNSVVERYKKRLDLLINKKIH